MPNPPLAGDSGARSCHSHTALVGLHHVGRGHWVRAVAHRGRFIVESRIDTIVGALRALVR